MYFTYKGKSSNSFGLSIYKSNYLGCSSRNVEIIPIQGRSGSLIIDHGNDNNFNLYFECDIKNVDLDEVSLLIAKWLKGDIGYSELNIYRNGKVVKTFQASFVSQIDIIEVAKKYGEIRLDFECKPQSE